MKSSCTVAFVSAIEVFSFIGLTQPRDPRQAITGKYTFDKGLGLVLLKVWDCFNIINFEAWQKINFSINVFFKVDDTEAYSNTEKWKSPLLLYLVLISFQNSLIRSMVWFV